jgi:hypothetical protein
LREAHQDHHNGISGGAMAAPRAMMYVLHMNVARRIGARPQRPASTPENQVAKIDEKQAGDSERDGERRKSKDNFTQSRCDLRVFA